MRVRVHVPGPLRTAIGGTAARDLELPGDTATVADVLEALDRRFPGLWQRVVDERGRVRATLRVLVDGRDADLVGGLLLPVRDGSALWVVRREG